VRLATRRGNRRKHDGAATRAEHLHLPRIRKGRWPAAKAAFQVATKFPMQPGSSPLSAFQKQLLAQGIAFFNQELFFECHEALEEAWLDASGEQKTFLQGLIQLAVALHHLRRENLNGAARLLAAGVEKLTPFCPQHEGVQVGRLLKSLEPLERQLGEGLPRQDWQPPKIES